MIGGFYIVVCRQATIFALVAGPVKERGKLDKLLDAARKAATVGFTVTPSDSFMIAYMAFDNQVAGVCNATLWINPEFEEL